jgi:hypothetical protein
MRISAATMAAATSAARCTSVRSAVTVLSPAAA